MSRCCLYLLTAALRLVRKADRFDIGISRRWHSTVSGDAAQSREGRRWRASIRILDGGNYNDNQLIVAVAFRSAKSAADLMTADTFAAAVFAAAV